MTNTSDDFRNPSRRRVLSALAATPALGLLGRPAVAASAVNTTGLAVTDSEVAVGILHSVTGTMAISETGSVEAEKLAIEQINAIGGVLGRKIKFVQEDGASDWPTFAEKAKKLLVNDKCASVFGCWTSASRKAVLPVFEQYNGMLYYPTFYEGLEQSKNVIYTGQEATQQIIAGLNWVTKTKGAKSFYLLGSDYIWPRTSNKIARKHIENVLKTKVVGEDYFSARAHAVQLRHQQDQADQARCNLRHHRRRLECGVLQAAEGGGNRPLEADSAHDLRDRGRDRWNRRREHRRSLCLHEIFPVVG